MKIGLLCQNPTAAGGLMKENYLCVSDMFTLCMWFLVVLDGISAKYCLVAPISTSTDEYWPYLSKPYSSWGTHEREPMCK